MKRTYQTPSVIIKEVAPTTLCGGSNTPLGGGGNISLPFDDQSDFDGVADALGPRYPWNNPFGF